MKNKISNVQYELIGSSLEGYKEVRVIFDYKGKKRGYFIYLKENKNTNYLDQAKKQFAAELKSGEVAKALKAGGVSKPAPWLIATTCVLGAAAIALASVLTYKYIADSNNVGTVEYLNNVIRMTKHTDGVLVLEKDTKYNNAWYKTEESIKSYNKKTGKLTRTTEYKCTYDKKNRILDDENITFDAEGNKTQRITLKCTYETDNKGSEYTETHHVGDDGVEFLYASSYDEYENTYTEEGKRTVNRGEDKQYTPDGEVASHKIRQGEGILPEIGRDSYSKSSAIVYHLESGELKSTDTLSQEAEYKWVSKTRENVRRLTLTKLGEVPENIELLIGYAEINENNQEAFNDFSTYTDREAQNLKRRTRIAYTYDDLNRQTLSKNHELDLSAEEEQWRLTNETTNSYIKSFKMPATTSQTSVSFIAEEIHIGTNSIERKFDKYGRVTYEEVTEYRDGEENSKSITEYEYGNPVPLGKDREQIDL